MLSSSKLGIDGCVDVIIDGLRGMGKWKMNKDLTVGNPEKVLWTSFVCRCLEVLSSSSYTTSQTAW